MASARDLIHPRDRLLGTMERIYRYRMTTTSGGNLSIRDEDGDVWITPARVDKGSLRRDDIIRVSADGAVEGPHPPSSELPFHRAIYEARPDIRGIVHAHPVALVAFSICRKVPETRLLHQARMICGEVGFAPYALPGSEALGRSIAGTFAEGYHCVVLENHGVVTGGRSLQEAFERFETLEFTAKTAIKAGILGALRYLEDGNGVPKVARAAGAPRSSAVSSLEKELRRQLRDFVRRAYQQRLMISTQGAFSARLGDDRFLITPHRLDRNTIEIGDIVLVEAGEPEGGKVPSGSSENHRAIYARQADVRAIANAYPVNATAFSVTDAVLDTRTIPESYLFLREVQRVPRALQFGNGQALAELSSLRTPIAVFENNGVQVCGTSILDAFDRLEVLESTAEAMINSRPIGTLAPMPDAVIAELKTAFGLD